MAVVIGAYFLFLHPKLPILNAYGAKQICSYTFMGGLAQEKIQNENLYFYPVNLSSSKINFNNKSVKTSLFGLGTQTVVFKDNLGCVQIHGEDNYSHSLSLPVPKEDSLSQLNKIWSGVSGVDYTNLQRAIDYITLPGDKEPDRKTLALAYFYKDTLVGEWYAPGYNPSTPILGWSMTKSVTSALYGILEKNGKITLNEDHLFPDWENDKRSSIKLNDLLQMQSGLEFNEEYGDLSDATRMLFMSDNVANIPMKKPLEHTPGTHWKYSSGTSNLLSALLRNKINPVGKYHAFPYDSLFHRIGMNDTYLETDESGNFIGSSYCYASARDWGRFGLLFLNHGNWWGDQIIDTTWVQYCSTANEHSNGIYGGHFWQNKNHSAYKSAPDNMFECNGFQGQYVMIFPSHNLVIVRLGVGDNFNKDSFIKFSLHAFNKVN
jgi:CubicO group peptidase (beta-lactamase class C family)